MVVDFSQPKRKRKITIVSENTLIRASQWWSTNQAGITPFIFALESK